MTLTQELKDAATAAFRDNRRLATMPSQERELAAQGYEELAQHTVGTRADLARLYNLERARFLRGQVAWIASTARAFGADVGYQMPPADQIGDQT